MKGCRQVIGGCGHMTSQCSDITGGCRCIIRECPDIIDRCRQSIYRCQYIMKGWRVIIGGCDHMISQCSDIIDRCGEISSQCRDIIDRCQCLINGRRAGIAGLGHFIAGNWAFLAMCSPYNCLWQCPTTGCLAYVLWWPLWSGPPVHVLNHGENSVSRYAATMGCTLPALIYV